jgi:hypothetical protein
LTVGAEVEDLHSDQAQEFPQLRLSRLRAIGVARPVSFHVTEYRSEDLSLRLRQSGIFNQAARRQARHATQNGNQMLADLGG